MSPTQRKSSVQRRKSTPAFRGVGARIGELGQVDLNDEFRYALDLIERQGQSVFLTGKAGTGKSTFLHYLRETTAKATVVLAPTGCGSAQRWRANDSLLLSISPYVHRSQ